MGNDLENAFELTCRYDGRKSFYGKALVVEHKDGGYSLFSYLTHVADIDKEGKYVSLNYEYYSQTTSRHIREFRKQFETAE